jgi:hypothetical protein
VNEVKLVVTGQYRPSGAVDKAKKDLAELAKFAAQAERVAKGLNEELDTGAKKAAKSTDAAKEAIKKLGKETDDAFDKLKAKMEESFKAAEEERVIKVKAEYDKQRLKNSFDSFTFDVDISSGLGPKLAAAYGKISDTIGKGIDLTKAGAKGAWSFVTGLSDGLAEQHPAVKAAVYGTLALAAAQAAPFIGGTLAGGIVAGFAGGIGALGVVAAAQNGKVRKSFSDVWSNIVEDVQARSGSIEAVLLRTAGRIQTGWNNAGHRLTSAFNDVAPGLEKLFDGLIRSGDRLSESFGPLAKAGSALFGDLGERLPGIIGEMSDSFIGLAESVEKAPRALGDFIAFAGETVEVVVDVVSWLNKAYDMYAKMFEQLGKPLEWVGLKDGSEAAGKLGKSMLDIAEIPEGPMQSLKLAIAAIGEASEDSAKKVDAVRQALDLLNGQTPDYTEGLAEAAEAVSALDGAFKSTEAQAAGLGKRLLDAQGAFDVTNENGRKLYANVRDVQAAFGDMAAAVADGQMSREQFIADAGRMRDRLNDTWRQAGLNEEQIAALNHQYSLTPDQLATLVRLIGAADAEQQMRNLARAREAVIYIRQQVSTYGGWVGSVNGQTVFHDRAHGGIVSKAAAGGVRPSNVVVNDWGATEHGEAIRLPQGSTVIPASMTRSMESRWGTDRGAGQGGLLQVNLVLDGRVLATQLIDPMKGEVRGRGGQPEVFG